MKLIARQKIWLAVVIVTNVLLWVIPSNVIEQIVRDRHTMLGRYSRTHFFWIIGVAMISVVSFYIDWSTGDTYKRRWFQVLATLMFLAPTIAVVDFVLRRPEAEHYIRDTIAYHRPPDQVFHETFVDKPVAFRTFPGAPTGYGTVECELHTDKRGYRNRTDLDQYDVVAIGDSFTEGSGVSDDDPWPVHLASKMQSSVYNAGMSGYDPLHYRETLRETAIPLKPKYVVCMIYEGNDFRSAKNDNKRLKPSLSKRFKAYMKQSPILSSLDELMVNTFGRIGADTPVAGADSINWMPLTIPNVPDAPHYAFAPKQMRDLIESSKEFAGDKHWLNPRSQLADMNELCVSAGAQLVIVFAPTKAHVTLPLVKDHVTGKQLRDFLALRYKKKLPNAGEFKSTMLQNTNAREQVVGQWCERERIAFLSLTAPLRKAAESGIQVYFTYDQHWTPPGHEVAARAIADFLGRISGNTARASSRQP